MLALLTLLIPSPALAADFVEINVTNGVPSNVKITSNYVATDDNNDDGHFRTTTPCTTVGLTTTPGTGSLSCLGFGTLPARVIARGNKKFLQARLDLFTGGFESPRTDLDIIKINAGIHRWSQVCTAGDVEQREIYWASSGWVTCDAECVAGLFWAILPETCVDDVGDLVDGDAPWGDEPVVIAN